MSRLFPGFPVVLYVGRQCSQGKDPGGVDEDRISHPPDYGEGLRRCDPHSYGRMGVLKRFGTDFQVVTLVVFPLEGELLSGPGL